MSDTYPIPDDEDIRLRVLEGYDVMDSLPEQAYDDYVKLGGEIGARDGGKLRSEGKDYVVQDGDVMLFRFNV